MFVILFASILCFSTKVLTTTKSNSNKKDEPPEDHLTTLTCQIALQCSGGKKTNTGCVLQKHQILNFNVVEEIKIESTPEADKVESFLMVQEPGHRYVYKASMTSNRTEKTDIFVKGEVYNMVYDRTSNTVFWIETEGIFKQVVAANSKRIGIERLRWLACLNINNGALFFKRNYDVYTISLTVSGSKKIWHSFKRCFTEFVINGVIACLRMVQTSTIECIDIYSKNIIFSLKCKNYLHMTLVKASYFGMQMLLFVEMNYHGTYLAKTVEITAEGHFKNPKEISSFSTPREVFMVPGFLLYNFQTPVKVEVWEINNAGRKRSVYYPSVKDSSIHFKVALM